MLQRKMKMKYMYLYLKFQTDHLIKFSINANTDFNRRKCHKPDAGKNIRTATKLGILKSFGTVLYIKH